MTAGSGLITTDPKKRRKKKRPEAEGAAPSPTSSPKFEALAFRPQTFDRDQI
jgi:hypothetical protein